MSVVATGQAHSIIFTGRNIDTDGIYGSDTQKNGIMCVQVACNKDYNSGLDVDGDWGSLSSNALSGHYVERGECQYLVTAVEILLMLRGYDPGGVESPGVFGDGLYNAVVKYQSENGLDVDGVAGVGTICSLMGVGQFASSGGVSNSGEWQKFDPNNLPNFDSGEFKCQCGCGGDVCDELKQKAQLMREKASAAFGCDTPFTITSGYRCPAHNAAEGGVSGSLHTKGKAFDFQIYHDGHYQMEDDMQRKLREIAHQCGLTTGNYYGSGGGWMHCQIGSSDYDEWY